MRYLNYLVSLLSVVLIVSCNDDEPTARESTFVLHRIGVTPVNGVVTFTELGARKVQVDISLENTGEGTPFPAHLHFGDIGITGELAYRLNDVQSSTGRSTTVLDDVTLTDGTVFTYDFLEQMNGSVKIHLNDSFFKNIAIAAGNVGSNNNNTLSGIAVCTGH